MLINFQSQAYDRQMYSTCFLSQREVTHFIRKALQSSTFNKSINSFFFPSYCSALQLFCLPSSFWPPVPLLTLFILPQLLCLPSSFCPPAPLLTLFILSPSSSAYPLHSTPVPLLTLFILEGLRVGCGHHHVLHIPPGQVPVGLYIPYTIDIQYTVHRIQARLWYSLTSFCKQKKKSLEFYSEDSMG